MARVRKKKTEEVLLDAATLARGDKLIIRARYSGMMVNWDVGTIITVCDPVTKWGFFEGYCHCYYTEPNNPKLVNLVPLSSVELHSSEPKRRRKRKS